MYLENIEDIIVLGLGNPTLCDDVAGLLIIDELINNYSEIFQKVKFVKNYSGGFDMLYEFVGFKKAIIIDSINTGKIEPGSCIEFDYNDLKDLTQPRLVDSHGLNLPTVIETGKMCGYEMPEDIYIFGIEGTEFTEFSEKPTAEVQAGIYKAVEMIVEKLKHLNDNTLIEYK